MSDYLQNHGGDYQPDHRRYYGNWLPQHRCPAWDGGVLPLVWDTLHYG